MCGKKICWRNSQQKWILCPYICLQFCSHNIFHIEMSWISFIWHVYEQFKKHPWFFGLLFLPRFFRTSLTSRTFRSLKREDRHREETPGGGCRPTESVAGFGRVFWGEVGCLLFAGVGKSTGPLKKWMIGRRRSLPPFPNDPLKSRGFLSPISGVSKGNLKRSF